MANKDIEIADTANRSVSNAKSKGSRVVMFERKSTFLIFSILRLLLRKTCFQGSENDCLTQKRCKYLYEAKL